MNYWIFKANPDHYRIDARLLDPAPQITWAVTRYHERIQKGDTVFIWRAGTPRGICAVMLIDDIPSVLQENDLVDDGYELPARKDAPAPAHWVKGHFTQRFPIIETSVIKKIDGLELFSFFSAFQQATNFTLTRPEGALLLAFIEEHKAEWLLRECKNLLKPAAQAGKPAPSRAVGAKKARPVAPANVSADTVLFKCAACGRYVVSSDRDRHVHEAHDGMNVAWKKTR